MTQFPPKTLYCRLGGPSWPIMAPNGASSFVTVLYLMSSSLLCKRHRSRSICNTNTAHSTSYYTLDKLSHIRQASTHSTSYRTHTLKSIPRISLYTQVHPAAVVLPFVRFLQAIFHCEIDAQVGNGRLNYINGYVSKDHDAVNVGTGEYKQKCATAPWLATYRLLSKSSPSIPEVAIRMAQLSEFEKSYTHVLL